MHRSEEVPQRSAVGEYVHGLPNLYGQIFGSVLWLDALTQHSLFVKCLNTEGAWKYLPCANFCKFPDACFPFVTCFQKPMFVLTLCSECVPTFGSYLSFLIRVLSSSNASDNSPDSQMFDKCICIFREFAQSQMHSMLTPYKAGSAFSSWGFLFRLVQFNFSKSQYCLNGSSKKR